MTNQLRSGTYQDESLLLEVITQLRLDVAKSEKKTNMYREDSKVARDLIGEYSNEMSRIKSQERLLRSRIKAVLTNSAFTHEYKLNKITKLMSAKDIESVELFD